MAQPNDYALKYMLEHYDFQTVLDIGCGDGSHATKFRAAGKTCYTVDTVDRPGDDFHACGDYLTRGEDMTYDAIWSSHVMEHMPNVGHFLEQVRYDVNQGGVICLSVPPYKPQIVGGHLTIWNAGLVLYNLVRAGFDCSNARVKAHGYNISVITEVRKFEVPELKNDHGDIETLAKWFPPECRTHGFDGNITELNW